MSLQPPLLLGLDCTGPSFVRLLLALDDGSLEPVILEHRYFRSQQRFEAYRKRFLEGRRVRMVGIGSVSRLKICGASPQTRFWRADLGIRNLGSFLMWGLPRIYQTAYQLLLLSCYEANSTHAIGLLQNNAACMRELMEESDRHLKLLTVALSAR